MNPTTAHYDARGLNQYQPPQPQPVERESIQNSLHCLEKAVSECRESIVGLDEAISPVLRKTPPSPGMMAEKPIACSSEVRERIDAVCRVVSSLNDLVRSISARVDI